MAVHRSFSIVLFALPACALARDGLGQTLSAEDPPQAVDPSQQEPEPSDDDDQDDVVEEEPTPPVEARDAGVKPIADAAVRPDASSDCPLTGLHALRVDANVTWSPDYGWNGATGWTPAVGMGGGTVSLLALADVEDGVVTLRACGASLPPVRSVAGTTVSGSFADELWDDVETRWTAQVETDCERPGCALRSDFVQPQLGLSLAPDADWPPSAEPIPSTLVRDDDDDGRPGVRFRLDAPLRLIAPNGYGWVDAVQVTELFLAMRVGVQLEGTLDSCGAASGTASELQLDSRILACSLDTGSECLDDHVALLQRSMPAWTAEGASWKLSRLPAGSGCEDVRAALP